MRYILALILLFAQPAYSAIVWQANFDNCTTNCTSAQTSPPSPSSWSIWRGGGRSGTADGTTHYWGEITSPGRGGTGKSFKQWRHSNTMDVHEYFGALDIYPGWGSYSEIYMRYYVRWPVEMDLDPAPGDSTKHWRWNTSAGNEIYLNFYGENGTSLRETATLAFWSVRDQNAPFFVQILDNAAVRQVWDGNWHCFEFRMNLVTNVFQFWLDGGNAGQPTFSTTSENLGGGTFTWLQHFNLGNSFAGSIWQNSWQAWETDDLVISTTYVGPEAVDPTPIINSISETVVSHGQTLTIDGQNLVNEDTTNWNTAYKTGTAYGFEGATPVGDGYTMGTGGTDPVYTTARKLMGSKSLKGHVQGAWSGSGSPGSYLSVPSGVTTGERWLRAYVQMDLLGGAFPTSYQRLFNSQTTGQYTIGTQGDNYFLSTYPVNGSPVNVLSSAPGGVLAEDRWYLLEARWKTSDPRAFDLYIDNALRMSGSNISSAEITNIQFPLVNFSGTTSAFSEDIYVDNFAVSTSRLGPSSLIEISDSATYHSGTYVYQEPIFLSDSSIQIKTNLTGLGNGPLFLWVTNNRGLTAGPYNISGSPSGDVTPPTTSAIPSSGTYLSTQTISLSCSDNVYCASTQYCWGVGCTPSTTYSQPLAIQTGTLGYRSTDSYSNIETTKYSTYVSAASDTSAPTLSDIRPYGVLLFGTTSATLSVTSSEGATCKYDASQQAYSSMANTFSTSDSVHHSASLTGLTNGSSYTYYMACQDTSLNTSLTSSITFSVSNEQPVTSILFTEDFQDNNYAARGWYDNTNHGLITTDGHNGNALQWTWQAGSARPTNGSSVRRLFEPTDTLFVSFYVKFATGWRGSGVAWHPHMFYILSDIDDAGAAPANNYLNTYIEFISDTDSPFYIRPSIALQDSLRVNTSYGVPTGSNPLTIDLTSITENRSVTQCNTPAPVGAIGACYFDGGWYSANVWKAPSAVVSDGVWHKIDVYFEMNTTSNGVGQYDGVMKFWVDGEIVIDKTDILYRTGQDANKKWGQFILGPYMWTGTTGSPINQSMAIDDLVVAKTMNLLPTWPPGHVRVNAPTQVEVDNPTQVSIMQ